MSFNGDLNLTLNASDQIVDVIIDEPPIIEQTIQSSSAQQVPNKRKSLSKAEEIIVETINNCLINWHKPWHETFLADEREFTAVHNLMDGLLHYEDQITNSDTVLTHDRINAISRAVARLVDYGNAILNIDLIVRSNDESSSELHPTKVTTIQLYQAHTKAHSLREKLLYDYFRKDKRSSVSGPGLDEGNSIYLQSVNFPGPYHPSTLQVPLSSGPSFSSPTLQSPSLERSQTSSNTSINTLLEGSGRRTPQQSLYIELVTNTLELSSKVEMTHMTATIRSKVFSSPSDSRTRLAMLPGIMAKIEDLLTVPTNAEKVANCFELLDSLLDTIEKLPSESREHEVNIIVDALLKQIVRKVYIDDRDNFVELQNAHWMACLLSIIRLMTPIDFANFLRKFNNLTDLSAFLKDYLFIVKRFFASADKLKTKGNEMDSLDSSEPTFPMYWIEMNLLASSILLTSLTYLYQNLRQLFVSSFQIWSSYLDCLVHVLLQNTLSPDRPMFKNRQSVMAYDIRKIATEYIRITWDSLSFDQRQQIIDDFIEPLLRATMILRSSQRSIILPIFHDMMKCDYTSQYIIPRSPVSSSPKAKLDSSSTFHDSIYEDDCYRPNLHSAYQQPSNVEESLPYLSIQEASEDGTVLTKFTHLIVGKLNSLVIEHGLGDEQFRDEFCLVIVGESHSGNRQQQSTFRSAIDVNQFNSMAKHTAKLIKEFLQICLDSRQANKLGYKHLYLLCLFKLILFFRDKVDRAELYLQNLCKLCSLHHAAGRYAEAGYTLLEYAKSLGWSDSSNDNHGRIIARYFQTTPQQTSNLKIFLYDTIIEYFDRGQLWEAATDLCRELMDYYEFKTYEYIKLASIHQKLASYFANIMDPSSRSNPEYFRVSFFGDGFPNCLRNVTMVYRGQAYEKLGDFQAKILDKYPDAKLLKTLAKPDENLLKDPGCRLLQINACSPVVDPKAKFDPNVKIDDAILNFYKHNECYKFQFSRRISWPLIAPSSGDQAKSKLSSDDNFANMWRERTTLTTNTLPGMLPFFTVYFQETSIVSPIESAIEDLMRTNDRLSSMVNRFKADTRHEEDIRLLGQLLLGVVDAAVNGGITKYEEAFFNASTNANQLNTSGQTATTNGTLNSGVNNSITSSSQLERQIHSIGHDRIGRTWNFVTSLKQLQQPDGGGGNHVDEQYSSQVHKLKCLIAQQVPLLDEAIRLHGDRVADVMRPQHEHLESSYKKLKHHVMSKYSRYLPPDYNKSSLRGYRLHGRSPNRSPRSGDIRMTNTTGRITSKRLSDVGYKPSNNRQVEAVTNDLNDSSNIPYAQLNNERRSLPFLTGFDLVDQKLIKSAARLRIDQTDENNQSTPQQHHKIPPLTPRNTANGPPEDKIDTIYMAVPTPAPRLNQAGQKSSYTRMESASFMKSPDKSHNEGLLAEDRDQEMFETDTAAGQQETRGKQVTTDELVSI